MIDLTPKQANKIIEVICDEFMVTVEDVLDGKRDVNLTEPRRMICYILCVEYGYSPSLLGFRFNKTHSTINHSTTSVQNTIETTPSYKAKVDRLIKMVKKEL